jgi:hypothetical protein
LVKTSLPMRSNWEMILSFRDNAFLNDTDGPTRELSAICVFFHWAPTTIGT